MTFLTTVFKKRQLRKNQSRNTRKILYHLKRGRKGVRRVIWKKKPHGAGSGENFLKKGLGGRRVVDRPRLMKRFNGLTALSDYDRWRRMVFAVF